ncbi:MAG: ABC transporter permease [Bacteroidetes bacterium]|nr:ABC transporter permease [Bacteroidota bacterium]
MIRNYLKIAWRNLKKYKTFSAINIAGLAIGLACFLLIALYVTDELSFDRYNENAEDTYRINCDLTFNGSVLRLPVASDMTGSTLKKDYPQVNEFTRVFANGRKQIKFGNNFINERNVAHADSTFFNVFTLPALQGDTKTALDEPNTVVISASAAKKYFGTTDAIGKIIQTDDNGKTLYKVTAVIKDVPENSHFHFDFIFSMKNVNYEWGNYLSNNFFTYIVLQPGTDYKAFEKKAIAQYLQRYVFPAAQHMMQISSMEEFEKAGNKLSYSLMPLTKIHLYSTDRDFELSPSGNIQYIYIFSAVAIFILLIACINFMNLTTARSANRAKEVGVRKVLGTDRNNLVLQFLFESVMMVTFSLIIAIALVNILLPAFNNIASKNISLNQIFSPAILISLFVLPLFVGLLAGSYPAFFLSRFSPAEVLKGKLNMGSKSSWLRSLLVVFQFATSIILIIGTIVIYHQLHFIQNTNLGFNKSQVLIINNTYALGQNVNAFKDEITKMQGVSSGTISDYLPVSSSRSDYTYSKDQVMNSQNGLNIQVWSVDYDYLKTMGMQLASGRNFSHDFGSDSSAVIINETAAKILGYANPIGKKIYEVTRPPAPWTSHDIVGVVKDFHFESLRQHIGPLCFRLGRSTGTTSFKVNAPNIPVLLAQVEKTWKTLAPGKPFSYRFMDESFDDMYRAEQRVGTIALIFSMLAIMIACLGLFGLSTFIAEQRTKEIGIRKVLGANVGGIVQLLSKDFVRLVLIAFVIAAPLAWYFMNHWLQDFAYRVQIGWWVFAVAGFAALIIALATVSFQAIKTALANPVKSLRSE